MKNSLLKYIVAIIAGFSFIAISQITAEDNATEKEPCATAIDMNYIDSLTENLSDKNPAELRDIIQELKSTIVEQSKSDIVQADEAYNSGVLMADMYRKGERSQVDVNHAAWIWQKRGGAGKSFQRGFDSKINHPDWKWNELPHR